MSGADTRCERGPAPYPFHATEEVGVTQAEAEVYHYVQASTQEAS